MNSHSSGMTSVAVSLMEVVLLDRIFNWYCLVHKPLFNMCFILLESKFLYLRTVSATDVSTSLLFKTRRSLLHLKKMGSPSLQLLGSGIANLLQMPPMYVSFVHDDVHLCLGLSLLIPRIPESYELSLDQIPSSNEKQKGSLSGPQHHHLPSLKHCSVCGPYQ